jgi:hypothetical protein
MRARNAGSDCSWLAARPQGIERDNALIVGGFYGATDAQAFADLCYMRWGLPRVAPSDPRTAVFRLETRKFGSARRKFTGELVDEMELLRSRIEPDQA